MSTIHLACAVGGFEPGETPMSIVLIRIVRLVRPVTLPGSRTVTIRHGGTHAITVAFRAMSQKDVKAGHSADSVRVIGVGRFELPVVLNETFRALAERRIPDVTAVRRDALDSDVLDDKGFVREGHGIDARWLRADYESFVNESVGSLFEVMKDIVYTARWVQGAEMVPAPLTGGRSEWSLDGRAWYQLPQRGHVEVWASPILDPAVSAKQVKALIRRSQTEPLHHLLWPEARSLQTSNRRAALVIGVAALEVAVKQYIADRVPNSEWLVFNLQSPPVVSILKNYVPTLPAVNTIGGKVLPPPKRLRNILDEAVQLRNDVAHRGQLEWKPGMLIEILDAIRDVLYLLDFYAGQSWAKACLSHTLQTELGL